MNLYDMECEGVGWTHLVQDRAQRQTLMNKAMNFQVAQLLASHEGLCLVHKIVTLGGQHPKASMNI
jgi:hypothetical protein